MVSAKLSSRLGSVKLKDSTDLKETSRSVMKRPTIKASAGNSMILGIINNHLSTSEKDKIKLTKK